MTSATSRAIIAPVGSPHAPEVALFLVQMDDQGRRLAEDTRGLTPEELAWQPAPGMNTIGMLLAHIAIVEVYWTSILMRIPCDCPGVLGIGEDDEGLPLPAHGPPPAALPAQPL